MNELDKRKQEEIDYHNHREEFYQNHTPEEIEKTWTNKKFYSIYRGNNRFVDDLLAQASKQASYLIIVAERAMFHCLSPKNMAFTSLGLIFPIHASIRRITRLWKKGWRELAIT